MVYFLGQRGECASDTWDLNPLGSMGLIYLATLLHLVDFYGFHVGKYTSPMDLMGPWVPNSKRP